MKTRLGSESFERVQRELSTVNWSASSWFKTYFRYAAVNNEVDRTSYAKEISDRIFAIFLLLCFSPIMLAVALAVKLSSRGPVLYKQVRVGKNGSLFKIFKFRTMSVDAEKATGHVLSWEGDPRVTPIGNFLRKSHLDELPQLFNVILGHMSFIGPRPERPEFTEDYSRTVPNYDERHVVKPGITGLAQIALIYDAKAHEKLTFDLMYIAYRDSMILDLLIMYYTAKKMLFLRPTARLIELPVNASATV